MKKTTTFFVSLFVILGVFGSIPGAEAQQDCSRIKSCLGRCQCYYDRCYAGCENISDSAARLRCFAGCDAFYSGCTNRC